MYNHKVESPVDTELEENKGLFTEISKHILNNDNYQKILFLFYIIGTYSCILSITIFPSQKNLPEYICLTDSI